MRTLALAIVVCAGAATGGCGVKGPLYLPPPPKDAAPQSRQNKPAQPAPPTTLTPSGGAPAQAPEPK